MTQPSRHTQPSSGGFWKITSTTFCGMRDKKCTTKWGLLKVFTRFSNITDVYEKIRANRRDIDKKCPRTKCDKILKKVKKVKSSVEVIQTMNLTVLEQMVEMLKNSSTAQQLLDLEPIKACMADPTVSIAPLPLFPPSPSSPTRRQVLWCVIITIKFTIVTIAIIIHNHQYSGVRLHGDLRRKHSSPNSGGFKVRLHHLRHSHF